MGVHSEDSLEPHPPCTNCSSVRSWPWLPLLPLRTLLRLLRPRLHSRLHSMRLKQENTQLSVLTPSIQSTMTYRLLRSLPPTWMMRRRSLLPRLNSKLLSMTLLLVVWLPNRLPLLYMSFLSLLLLLWLLLPSLPPTHMLLVSPFMVWDMLAFPTLLVWDTTALPITPSDITVLAFPTLGFLWWLLLLLLPKNEQFSHFFLLII